MGEILKLVIRWSLRPHGRGARGDSLTLLTLIAASLWPFCRGSCKCSPKLASAHVKIGCLNRAVADHIEDSKHVSETTWRQAMHSGGVLVP